MAGSSLEAGERISAVVWSPVDFGSVWWDWFADTAGPVTVTIDADFEYPGGFFSPSLELDIYTGDLLSQLTHISNGGSCGNFDERLIGQVTFEATAGRHYLICLTRQSSIGEYSINVAKGSPPMVVLESPVARRVFKTGEAIHLSAQLFDLDSPASHVAFYEGVSWYTQVGQVEEWPFTLNWTNAPPGNHRIVARGWDATGLSSFSLPVMIDVVPNNDAFADRIVLTGSSIDTHGNLEHASWEEGEPQYSAFPYETIWWSWTALADGYVTLSTDASELSIYTGGDLDNLILVTNAVSTWPERQAVFIAQAGETYAIALGGCCEVSLHLRMSRPPLLTISIPTNQAVFIQGEPIPLQVSAQDPEGALSSLEIWVGTFRTNVNVGTFETVFRDLPVGQYFVGAKATDSTGLGTWKINHVFQVQLPKPEPPSNDHYTNRITVTGAPLVLHGTTIGATTEPGEDGSESIWWRWIAPASGPTVLNLSGSGTVRVYTGDAQSAWHIIYQPIPPFFFGWGSEGFIAEAGVPYQIRVYNSRVRDSPGNVALQILQSPPPRFVVMSPTNGSHFTSGDTVHVMLTMTNLDWGIGQVQFYAGDGQSAIVTNAPYTFQARLETDYSMTRDIYVVATDTLGWIYRTSIGCPLEPVPPANDTFAGRLQLTNPPFTTTGSTAKARWEPGEPGIGQKSVWYTWKASDTGRHTFRLEGHSSSLWMAVYTGDSLTNLTLVAQATNEWTEVTYRTELTIDATEGADYHLAVIDLGSDFRIGVYSGQAPAIQILNPTGNTDLWHGEEVSFNVEAVDPDGDLAQVDFYLNRSLLATMTEPPFSVDYSAKGLLTYVPDPPGIGERYFLQAVATDRQGLSSSASVHGNIRRVVRPVPNDRFADRIQLRGLLASGGLSDGGSISFEPGEPRWFDEESIGSVWWSWRAPASGLATVHCGGAFHVLTGPEPTLGALGFVGSSQTNVSTYTCQFYASGGTEYYIRVVDLYPSFRLQLLLTPAQPAHLSAWRLSDGDVRLDFQSLANLDWIFQYSEDLHEWVPFSTNRSRLQQFSVMDPGAPLRNRRFYRAVGATPTVLPSGRD